ncbi:hypothetical protein [Brucella pseudogrignonensis]|uniref:Uncharacterized protein n=1 Tax=Brucella pseudogrignonensis TaxID=419475 RepID=A0ABU1MFY5_9HYPH|nr:hypothetical protein [Brucella pseudogrignonensis]MDR6434641.1 hypothetical protein [Brucella pseudogrignonensis]
MTEQQKVEDNFEKAIKATMTTGMFVIILFSVFVTSSIVANKFFVPNKYEHVSSSKTGERIQTQILTAKDIALASVSERDLIDE